MLLLHHRADGEAEVAVGVAEAGIACGEKDAGSGHLVGNAIASHAIMPALSMTYTDGRLMCTINPPLLDLPPLPTSPTVVDPGELVPLSVNKSGEADSPVSLIIQGLGLDPSLFVEDPQLASNWEKLNDISLEELLDLYDKCWDYLEKFAAEQLTKEVRNDAKFAFSCGNCGHALLKKHLIGGNDTFSTLIISANLGSDGMLTQGEDIADLWKAVYSDTKLSSFPKKDEHSHARLRVNGVDRNNILYLPPERRAVIW